MKKNIELLMAKQFAELAQLTLDAVMKDDSLTDKEYNSIREAHDSIASARDTIERLTALATLYNSLKTLKGE